MITNKRATILEAAKRTFSLFGYKGTSVAHVAKLAGVGKGTIYTEFKHKEEMLEAVMDDFLHDLGAIFERVKHEDERSVLKLHRALYDTLQYRKEHQLLIHLTEEVSVHGTKEAVSAMQKVEDFIMTSLERAIAQGVEKGRLQVNDTEITAFTIYKLYIAFIVDWEEKKRPLTEEELFQVFENHIFNGIVIR
ncbi:TetR/AcrR family transcriptional regulator [Natribacillus halophilus]|uniref:DNA-binding transcriptional regulator, AcrR family n=1 Tax=Natribacillus halophilus TaxID=549003 RepID=A0A1G8QHJ6_9BACI|nr:TetR/AcrR family transcriptional regulator [Natribacillus halophilus]SDJ04284.1 DNA-binding transcriptional regulator, AcrR family [Natribacillus halophilus]